MEETYNTLVITMFALTSLVIQNKVALNMCFLERRQIIWKQKFAGEKMVKNHENIFFQ